jgi:hypothetical protein
LRALVGREATVHLYGPSGFIERVGHKLQAYQWNLADRFLCDLIFMVSEVDVAGSGATPQFRLKNYFEAKPLPARCSRGGVIHNEPMFRVATAILEHRTPCLAFALEEAAHVNIWKNRLFARGLPVVWAECAACPELEALQGVLLEAFGKLNERPFRPHVTLARIEQDSATARRHPIDQRLSLTQSVCSVELFRSPPPGMRGYPVVVSSSLGAPNGNRH